MNYAHIKPLLSAFYILTASEWVKVYQERWGDTTTAQKIGNSRLVANKGDLSDWFSKGVSPLFVREQTGVYRFLDPRMPSFIRLALSGAANDLAQIDRKKPE